MMTSRERVRCALNHQEPDRVPLFFGSSGATTIHAHGYEKLKKALGIDSPTRLMSRAMQYVHVDRRIMDLFGSDGIPLNAKAPPPSQFTRNISEKAFVDEWGIRWELEPDGWYYSPPYKDRPLEKATIQDIESNPWPDVTHPAPYEGLAEEAKNLYEKTSYAIIGNIGTCLCELIYHMRGMENWMMDLVADRDFAHALLRKITDLRIAAIKAFLDRVGAYVDVFIMGDDMGSQHSLLISPQIYRTMIKPYHTEIIAAVKAHSPAKVFFHSDGNIYPLIQDFIDAGVDLLNPVQVSADDMGDTARLKREFGDRLSFCGAIDTQWVLPNGSPDDVREEVRRRIKDLAPGGGYICASVHCIQRDVPVENIMAMCEEVKVSGKYPLKL
jgi:uroporphyrinogen decarboxylase